MPRTSLSQEDLDVLPPVAKTARVQIPEPTELSSDSEDERQLKSLPTVNGELQVSTNVWLVLLGPRQANLVLIAYASSEGSGEPAHPRSLARTSAAR